MSEKAMVLCSGGVDSTTCLALAIEKHGKENVCALSIYYGQKHVKEIQAAKAVLEYYGIEGTSLDLTPVFAYSDCSLLSHSTEDIPEESYAEQLAQRGGYDLCAVPQRSVPIGSGKRCAVQELQRNLLRCTSRRCRRQCLSRLQRGIRKCDEPLHRTRLGR